MNKNQQADPIALGKVISSLDFQLPNDYLEFMQESNGAEGILGNNYLVLWRIEDLINSNKDYNVDQYAPGFFIFGSNGGGTAYAMDKQTHVVVAFEFVGMLVTDSPTILGSSFTNFLERLPRQ